MFGLQDYQLLTVTQGARGPIVVVVHKGVTYRFIGEPVSLRVDKRSVIEKRPFNARLQALWKELCFSRNQSTHQLSPLSWCQFVILQELMEASCGQRVPAGPIWDLIEAGLPLTNKSATKTHTLYRQAFIRAWHNIHWELNGPH